LHGGELRKLSASRRALGFLNHLLGETKFAGLEVRGEERVVGRRFIGVVSGKRPDRQRERKQNAKQLENLAWVPLLACPAVYRSIQHC